MAIATSTALIIAAVVGAVGTGVGAYSAYQSGQAQKEQGEENEKISLMNAVEAKRKADYDEEAHRERVRKILKTQSALYGGSGVTMEGSPLMVQADTANQGEMDALAIRRGGNVDVIRQTSAAKLYRMQGNEASRAGTWQAGSSLLSGGSSAVKAFA